MRGSKPVILLTSVSAIVVIGLLCATGCTSQSGSQPGKETTSKTSGEAAQPAAPQPASQPPAPQPAAPQVVIDTSLGRIVLELDPVRAPAATANFLKYVDDGFYDGLIFHRVIQGFMIQAGGFTTGSEKKEPTYPPVRNESRNTSPNNRGTIAMARTNDPNSATSQFFISTKDNDSLNYGGPSGGYTVFGRVIDGMDVVDRIAGVPVHRTGVSEAQPIEDVVIRSIRRK